MEGACRNLGKPSLKPLKEYDAIRQGLQATPNDREEMPKRSNFYVAQLTMLTAEAKRYVAIIAAASVPPAFAADVRLHYWHGALIRFMDYGWIMLEEAGHLLLGLPGAYGGGRNPVEHPFQVYKSAEQVIYGRFSGLTHDDLAPFVGTAVIRTALEIRLRSAFGIYGYADTRNKNIVPIDLGQLLDCVASRLNEVEFAVDFHDLVKIYRWSNPYLHAGWRDFPWVPGYVVQFLRPLFGNSKPTPSGGHSMNGGIRMPRATWRGVQQHFLSREPKRGFWGQFLEWAYRKLGIRSKPSPLVLLSVDESEAACVFLD
jgi:hypothetical protein